MQADNKFYAAFPRPLIEALAISSLILSGYLLAQNEISSGTSIIAYYSLLAFSSLQKLLPAFQIIYANFSAIQNTSSPVNEIITRINNQSHFYHNSNNRNYTTWK